MKFYLLILSVLFMLLACKKGTKVSSVNPIEKITHHLHFDNPVEDDYALKGFQEVVCSVTNLKMVSNLYQEVAGWEIAYEGEVSKEQLSAWQVADTASAKEVLLYHPENHEGFLRLVQFINVPQRQIRSSAQVWDTGGIFDINVRVKDLQKSFYELQRRGWNAYHDPVEFTFGKFHVEEVLMRGHDGIVMAMIQRHAPPLEGYPNLKKVSHIFNTTQIVSDIEQSLNFYIDGLGFKIYMEHKGASTNPGENVLGLPYNLTDDYERSIYILHPQGNNFGSIELLQFHGISGKNHADYAIPPNLGILMLRFPVHNIEYFRKKLQKSGIAIKEGIRILELPPYGKVKCIAIQTPDGAWLEFVELIN